MNKTKIKGKATDKGIFAVKMTNESSISFHQPHLAQVDRCSTGEHSHFPELDFVYAAPADPAT